MRLDEVDFNGLAKQVTGLRKRVKPGDLAQVMAAIESLRDLPFPPGQLDYVKDELLRSLSLPSPRQTSVYLAFYGEGDAASHMKIGISRSVKSRLSGIKTGNPLPIMFAFEAAVISREDALTVEQALLTHMSHARLHGEWVHVGGLSLQAAEAVVGSLAEVASEIIALPVNFKRIVG